MFSVYSVYLFVCTRHLCIWLMLAGWLPCWKRASHIAHDDVCFAFSFSPGVWVGISNFIVSMHVPPIFSSPEPSPEPKAHR